MIHARAIPPLRSDLAPLQTPSKEDRIAIGSAIPLRAHLIWFGKKFPWVNVLAVRSAALRGEFEKVILHHDCDLASTPHYRELMETPGVTLRRLDVPTLLASCAPYEHGLREVYARLGSLAARADLVRFAILYSEGGVYLDIDTVTLQSFRPLCQGAGVFCGVERVVYPAAVRRSRNPLVQLLALARSQLRAVLRRLPGGWAMFRRVEGLFPLAANNAVLGSAARSRFMSQCIEHMLALPPERQSMPYAIGPHLLQAVTASYRGSDLVVHASHVFFPFGPEISQHWFRRTKRVQLDLVLSSETRLIHWYASVCSRDFAERIDPAYVRANARGQLFSAIAEPLLPH